MISQDDKAAQSRIMSRAARAGSAKGQRTRRDRDALIALFRELRGEGVTVKAAAAAAGISATTALRWEMERLEAAGTEGAP